MSPQDEHESTKLPRLQRLLLAALGTGLLAMLAVAATLKPDPRGYGTHRQLGFPPCSFTRLCGIRCPSCGMTTSWAHLVRGNVAGAIRANAGGTVLGVLALTIGFWSLVSGLRGRWLWRAPSERAVVAVVVTIVVVTAADWIVRLTIF